MEKGKGLVRPTKPPAQHWLTFAVGRGGFSLGTFANTRDKRIGVWLTLSGPDTWPHFCLLEQDKDNIEKEIGESLAWKGRQDRKQAQILLHNPNTDPAERSQWPDQHAWLREKLEIFHRVFSPKIKQLDASEYSDDEEDDEE